MESSDTKNSRDQIGDQRKHQRNDFSFTVVEYVLHPDITYEIFIGFTLNISGSGMCLYTPKLLKEGQVIIIKSSIPPLSQKATVCWIEKYDSVYYKVGLEFVK